MSRVGRALAATVFAALAIAASAEPFDWTPAREESVIEVLTSDLDGELRETPVWIVVVDDTAFVRTNGSKWLANIRRGSPVRVRMREVESGVFALEITDAALKARVEEAFKAKYGLMQRFLSALRMSEPAVIRLRPKPQ